ncbi:Alpha/Beta hydrolase protein [Zopfochytrium polystomum]|nr:Alpha/Beta hydrolase protein [Zopfochytrium polystomum]
MTPSPPNATVATAADIPGESAAPLPSPYCREAGFHFGPGLRIAASVWSSRRNEAATRILAVHGIGDNAASWDHFLSGVFEVAPDAFHVVAIDLPGHGFSDHWVREGVCFQITTEWFSFVILSHSLGAEISSLLAAAMPERVSHYIAFDGLGPYRYPGSAADFLRAGLARHTRAVGPKRVFPTVAAATAARMNGMFPLSAPAAGALIRRSLAPAEPSTTTDPYSGGGGFVWSSDPLSLTRPRYDYQPDCIKDVLAAIRAPTLSVWADGSSAAKRYAAHERVRLISADVTVVVMPGGHHVHLEPDTVGVATFAALKWLERQGVPMPFAAGKSAGDVLSGTTATLPGRVRRVELRNGWGASGLVAVFAAHL